MSLNTVQVFLKVFPPILRLLGKATELVKAVVVSKMEITTQHGAIENKCQAHDVDFFSLDAIIAVGCRVRET